MPKCQRERWNRSASGPALRAAAALSMVLIACAPACLRAQTSLPNGPQPNRPIPTDRAPSGGALHNTVPGSGSGPGTFGKHYGIFYGDSFSSKLLGSALLPSVLRQDARSLYRGSAPSSQPARPTMLSGFLARHDIGSWEPTDAHTPENSSAGAPSAPFHSTGDPARKLALHSAVLGAVGGAGVNFMGAFVLRAFSRVLPSP